MDYMDVEKKKQKKNQKKEETQQAAAEKAQKDSKESAVSEGEEVKNGPLTKADQWTTNGESKVTLVKIANPKQTYDFGPVKLTNDSVKLLMHSNVTDEVSEILSQVMYRKMTNQLNLAKVKKLKSHFNIKKKKVIMRCNMLF